MSDTVYISTHRLPVAGALREAFREEDFRVELVPGAGHLVGGGGGSADEPALLILTGPADAERWATRARDDLDVPLFTVFPGEDARERGAALGAEETFGPLDPSPAEVALVGRRTVERRRLQEQIGIVGESEPMRELLERVVQMAPVDSTVLITGESGTGKELVARGIHYLSPRRHRAFLAVNVAALSDTLLESELFGHEKGAFTGAIDRRKGFFELADRGTLFLDEIGEMPMSTQTKLLRVLEQREFLRVGGESPIRVDVRIIAATNRELREMVREGTFRRDLYYRLNILDLRLPPLRDRPEDLPVLARYFIREISQRMDRPFPGISAEAMRILRRHSWPGNVRELKNLVESMVVLAPGREIGPDDIPDEIRGGGRARGLEPASVTGPRAMGEAGDGKQRSGPGTALTPRAPMVPSASDGTPGRAIQPELEFVFRTLMDLKVDMEDLRRDFEIYREEVDERLDQESGPATHALSSGIEIGTFGAADPQGEGPSGPGDAGEPSAGTDEGEDDAEPDRSEASDGFVFRPGMTIEEMEARAIEAVLEEHGGNRRKAAESLGIGERTLYRKIRRYEIEA